MYLLLTPEREDSAALLMKHLGQRYVQYINRTYRRSGTLWEGRFRSCLTQTEDYVLSCYRYIELNPVRAAMVKHPREYRWSSYRANAEGKANALLTPHDTYERLGEDEMQRHQAYRALFHAHLEAGVNRGQTTNKGGRADAVKFLSSMTCPAALASLSPASPGTSSSAAITAVPASLQMKPALLASSRPPLYQVDCAIDAYIFMTEVKELGAMYS